MKIKNVFQQKKVLILLLLICVCKAALIPKSAVKNNVGNVPVQNRVNKQLVELLAPEKPPPTYLPPVKITEPNIKTTMPVIRSNTPTIKTTESTVRRFKSPEKPPPTYLPPVTITKTMRTTKPTIRTTKPTIRTTKPTMRTTNPTIRTSTVNNIRAVAPEKNFSKPESKRTVDEISYTTTTITTFTLKYNTIDIDT